LKGRRMSVSRSIEEIWDKLLNRKPRKPKSEGTKRLERDMILAKKFCSQFTKEKEEE